MSEDNYRKSLSNFFEERRRQNMALVNKLIKEHRDEGQIDEWYSLEVVLGSIQKVAEKVPDQVEKYILALSQVSKVDRQYFARVSEDVLNWAPQSFGKYLEVQEKFEWYEAWDEFLDGVRKISKREIPLSYKSKTDIQQYMAKYIELFAKYVEKMNEIFRDLDHGFDLIFRTVFEIFQYFPNEAFERVGHYLGTLEMVEKWERVKIAETFLEGLEKHQNELLKGE